MGIEFDGKFSVRDITLSDIKNDMLSQQRVWDYLREHVDRDDPIMEDFNRVLMRDTEMISCVAAEKGFDDINELEEALFDEDAVSFLLKF